ncbi:MAG: hypoxanthine phosphoribosyltransferase [Acidobacteria bacterium]|nr:hypoxanthine phosphoribosyltransferase [Acidobacteriota bacterium]
MTQWLLPPDELRAGVQRLGAAISADHPSGLVLVGVLPKSVVFVADLCRAVTVDVEIGFVAVSRYAPGAGRARLLHDLDLDIAGRDVVLAEALVDTGPTISYLLGVLRQRGPRSLAVCALLDRPGRRVLPVEVAWRGFELEAPYVVGYGLDRPNLAGIVVPAPEGEG